MDLQQKDRRLKFDAILRDLQISTLGYQHTYFEPTESTRMEYDAVVYSKTTYNVKRADNKGYIVRPAWFVIIISRDPETPLPRAFQEFFMYCSPGKFFSKDNLYHYPFTIVY